MDSDFLFVAQMHFYVWEEVYVSTESPTSQSVTVLPHNTTFAWPCLLSNFHFTRHYTDKGGGVEATKGWHVI